MRSTLTIPDDRTPGSVIEISCSEGFVVTSSADSASQVQSVNMTCQDDLQWDDTYSFPCKSKWTIE